MGAFLALRRECYRNAFGPVLFSRPFTQSHVSMFRNKRETIRIPSKKALAAKQKRRAAKTEYLQSKMEQLKLVDAISVLRSVEVASPKAMYELYIKTEMGSGVAVPKGRFKLPKEAKPRPKEQVLVFAEGRQVEDAKRAGAHIVGGIELIDGILNNRIRATTYLSTTSMIRAITPRLGRFLGQQGLMPAERRGTVTDDIAGYMRRIQGTNEWKADKTGNIHMPIGSMHFTVDEVVKNFKHFMTSVKEATGNIKNSRQKETDKKPVLISKVLLSSTRGPGIRITDC
ncbi:ribosomal protein L1-like protein [Rhodocollybia butyracea]|uniref:Ribosomal protein L1-like protein n=1 Tax=Rhodocollybia butyracea TaxID=206335 RepID=A0A9P5Q5C7_9AGAR|nr:ribosomal protein L1-like protein [Rhodocollybia butyracea]